MALLSGSTVDTGTRAPFLSEAAGLDLADIKADHLPDARLVHPVGSHQHLGDHAAVVANLDLLGVKPQVRVGALERGRSALAPLNG